MVFFVSTLKIYHFIPQHFYIYIFTQKKRTQKKMFKEEEDEKKKGKKMPFVDGELKDDAKERNNMRVHCETER
jgi:hypothetical protein